MDNTPERPSEKTAVDNQLPPHPVTRRLRGTFCVCDVPGHEPYCVQLQGADTIEHLRAVILEYVAARKDADHPDRRTIDETARIIDAFTALCREVRP